MKIVFMGSADFGIPCIEKLINEGFDIAGIVTTPPRRKGRGLRLQESPVSEFAESIKFTPVLKPDSLRNSDFISELTGLGADLFVIVAYRILPEIVFTIPPKGTINLHASVLPKYRGSAPIQRAIEAGEKETGVSVFRIDKGVDTGNFILQRKLLIGEKETTPQLYERLATEGADALIEACRLIECGKAVYKTQNSNNASGAPKLRKEESWIDWNLFSFSIFNKIRAFKPFPGTCTMIGNKRINIEWAEPVEGSSGIEKGRISAVSSDYFEVECKDSRLRVFKVKPSDKKSMNVREFLNGTKIEKGMKIG